MDSLTQIVLGAGIGEVMMGKKMGNKAQLIGAIAGTVPDLDVIITTFLHDPIANLQIHRSYSHAAFTHVFLAFPLAYITHIILKRNYAYKSLYWLWFMGLFTHAILDSFTTYGTQLLLPFTNYLVGFNNISIIDPLYTLPFLFILVACLFRKRDDPTRIKLGKFALFISSFYMLLTFAFKGVTHYKIQSELKRQEIAYDYISTSPTIFNSFLWAGMAINDSSIYSCEYSIFQKNKAIEFTEYKRHKDYAHGFESEALSTMLWFSQDKYFIQKPHPDTLEFFITKWGRGDFTKKDTKETFFFYTKIFKTPNGVKTQSIEPKIEKEEFYKALNTIWDRIFHY